MPSGIDVGGAVPPHAVQFHSPANRSSLTCLEEPEKKDEEGVEVVLLDQGKSKVIGTPAGSRPTPDQNVFRHPQAVRHHLMRPPDGSMPSPYPYTHGSGSWGYGPPLYHHPHRTHAYGPPRPFAVPPYPHPLSASFEDKSPYGHPTSQYSPHLIYPLPDNRYYEDVNVISPNHKSDHPQYQANMPPGQRPMHPPHPHSYYQYPPASPVRHAVGTALSGPPRIRNYAMRRHDVPYSKAQQKQGEAGWGTYPSPQRSASGDMTRSQPPLVAETSFDSESHGRPTLPATPSSQMMPPPPVHDPQNQLAGGGSWGSYDSVVGPPLPPPPPSHYDDHRYFNAPVEQSYSSYMASYSPVSLYPAESFPGSYGYGPAGSFPYSYDEDDALLKDYYPDGKIRNNGLKNSNDKGAHHLKQVTPPSKSKHRKGDKSASSMLLPKAAEEVDFDVTDPPAEPVTPPSKEPVCDSTAEVNVYDILCGRGGGTNSQVGNRRFRKLVQDFQPTYLLARRKEKPLLARTIVLIIRKRGGRFLRKDEDTGALYEVGDTKAEAKTSQALREGLDVRATKSAATSLLEKKNKDKKGDDDEEEDNFDNEPSPTPSRARSVSNQSPARKSDFAASASPPSLPRLHVGEDQKKPSMSSEQSMHVRKRRRMRVSNGVHSPEVATPRPQQPDRFLPDFCPPRAELSRTTSLDHHDEMPMHMSTTPIRRNKSSDEDIRANDDDAIQAQGCTGVAFDMMTGAATSSFCLGPNGWRGRCG